MKRDGGGARTDGGGGGWRNEQGQLGEKRREEARLGLTSTFDAKSGSQSTHHLVDRLVVGREGRLDLLEIACWDLVEPDRAVGVPTFLHGRMISCLSASKVLDDDVEVARDGAEEARKLVEELRREDLVLLRSTTVGWIPSLEEALVVKSFVVALANDSERVVEEGEEMLGFDDQRAANLVILRGDKSAKSPWMKKKIVATHQLAPRTLNQGDEDLVEEDTETVMRRVLGRLAFEGSVEVDPTLHQRNLRLERDLGCARPVFHLALETDAGRFGAVDECRERIEHVVPLGGISHAESVLGLLRTAEELLADGRRDGPSRIATRARVLLVDDAGDGLAPLLELVDVLGHGESAGVGELQVCSVGVILGGDGEDLVEKEGVPAGGGRQLVGPLQYSVI